MARVLNVALIGYGLAGRVFHAPLIGCVDGLRLAAIVSRQAEAICKEHPGVAVLPAPEAAFADPSIDLVVVAAPNDTHFDLAARALSHGKHVVVDKPFAATAAEARELAKRAEQAGRILSVFHNRRWDADFLTVKRLIENGVLGEIVYFESHFDRFRPHVADRWREKPGPAAGTWFDLGPHLADQALQLFGAPRAVFADLARQRDGAAVTDYFHVLLRYDTLRVVLQGSSLAAAADLRFVVHGTRGSFVKHGLDAQEAFLRSGGNPEDGQFGVDPRNGVLTRANGSVESVLSERGDYRCYYAAIREAIAKQSPSPVTPAQGIAVMDILESAELSASRRSELPLSIDLAKTSI